MITYYHFGNWCGYFRTVSSTETLEEFNKHLEEQKLTRNSNKILNSKGEHCGVIESDTTNQ